MASQQIPSEPSSEARRAPAAGPAIHSICCSAAVSGGRRAGTRAGDADQPAGREILSVELAASLVERTTAVDTTLRRKRDAQKTSVCCRRTVSSSKNTIHVRFEQRSQHVRRRSSQHYRRSERNGIADAVSRNDQHQTDTHSTIQPVSVDQRTSHVLIMQPRQLSLTSLRRHSFVLIVEICKTMTVRTNGQTTSPQEPSN